MKTNEVLENFQIEELEERLEMTADGDEIFKVVNTIEIKTSNQPGEGQFGFWQY